MRLNLTLTFFIIALAVFFLQLTNIFDWRLFAFTPALAFDMPWTFITSIFLHGGFSHLFFNMFALLMFGLSLENRIGPKNYLVIFFLAGMLGSIGYMFTAGNPNTPAVGMSGAIYGIMGALAMIMPGTMVFIGGFFPMPMIFAVFFWGVSEFLGLFYPSGIARGAHLAGLFIGILYGLYIRKQEKKYGHRRHRVEIHGYANWER
ncbi:MAG: rhomboid family intramembrane serine protease [Candidatus Aenigmarchaeota archaeon]|nr:rhomboid family intramembrane serine protease [Candidatus Aenigmarchaeota archaeon]